MAAAITEAYSAALTTASTIYITHGWGQQGHVLAHAQPNLLGVTVLGTVFLLQNAQHTGPIVASRTTSATVDPLVSILLGAGVFGDRLRGGVPSTAMECAALAALVAGVAVLSRSSLVAGTPPYR
ncbi:MAG: hypothetical protein ACYCV7_15920 [Acidimicrobiales bacterium]